MSMTTILKKYFEEIDFAALRKQKRYLNEHCDTLKKGTPECEAVEGVIALLDDIQDSADVLGIEDVFAAPSKNENILENVRCPECGSEDSFEVVISTLAIVTDDGSEPVGDQEWDGMSHVRCRECGNSGRMWEFQT